MWCFYFLAFGSFKNEKPRMLRGEFFWGVLRPDGEAAGPATEVELTIFPTGLADRDVASGLGDLASTPEEERGTGRDESGADCRADDGLPIQFHLRRSSFPAGSIPANMMNGLAKMENHPHPLMRSRDTTAVCPAWTAEFAAMPKMQVMTMLLIMSTNIAMKRTS